MARKRQLDPEYPFEEEIAKLSIPARYFYILSWCHMDDTNGVLPFNIYKLKGQVFPEDNIDIEPIIQELIDMRRLFPFEVEGKKWLWCPTLLKHQVINHPSKRRYPNPPEKLREDYRNGKLALTLSRVELSRVERDKEHHEPSAALKDILKQVNAYINIYSLINQLKKEYKAKKAIELYIPDEVLIKVCESYLANRDNIKAPWSWFIKAVEMAWGDYNAVQTQKQNTGKRDNFAPAIKEIMKGIGG